MFLVGGGRHQTVRRSSIFRFVAVGRQAFHVFLHSPRCLRRTCYPVWSFLTCLQILVSCVEVDTWVLHLVLTPGVDLFFPRGIQLRHVECVVDRQDMLTVWEQSSSFFVFEVPCLDLDFLPTHGRRHVVSSRSDCPCTIHKHCSQGIWYNGKYTQSNLSLYIRHTS